MSFSGDVKRELSEHVGSARHCLIAELAALICACGQMSADPPCLEVHTENEVPYKKTFTLLQKAFTIKSLQEHHQEGGGWSLKITEPAEILTVLSACGLVQRTADGWRLEGAPEERITERVCCRKAYIRGAFLGSGSINDPNKNYHLEFVLEQKEKAESELRILLLLSQTKRALSREEIVHLDFITIYSADFGIGEENLHGDNNFKYGEFASRLELAWAAIKQLVVEGLVSVVTKDGFSYKISAAGLQYTNALESAYSAEYRDTARKVIQQYSNYSEKEIRSEIDKKAIESARRMKSCTI